MEVALVEEGAALGAEVLAVGAVEELEVGVVLAVVVEEEVGVVLVAEQLKYTYLAKPGKITPLGKTQKPTARKSVVMMKPMRILTRINLEPKVGTVKGWAN